VPAYSPEMDGHLWPLVVGKWALWRTIGVRAAGFPVDGLTAFGAGETAALQSVVEDPRFREAVTWQNRQAYATALARLKDAPEPPTSKWRQRLELAASYWQRYCAKNDTIGFFGPIGWGELTDDGPAVAQHPGRDLLAERTVRLEVWAVDALARALEADPVVGPHGPFAVPVVPDPAAALEARIAAITDKAARERATAVFSELEAARQAVADAAGDPDRLESALDGADATFMLLTGQDATRRHGLTYGARTVCYEDCRRDHRLEVGPGLRDALAEALHPLLASAAWWCGEVAEVGRQMIGDVIPDQDGPVPFGPIWARTAPAMLGVAGGAPPPMALVERRAELQARWAELIAAGVSGARADEVFADPKPAWEFAVFHAPDVQIAAADTAAIERGDLRVVVGDFHPGTLTVAQSLFLCQHPEPDLLREWCALDCPEPRMFMSPPRDAPRMSGRIVPSIFTLRDVALLTTPDCCPAPGQTSVAPADLVIDGERVRSADGEVDVPLDRPWGFAFFLMSVATYDPFPHDEHSPRLTVGRAVLRRETWRVDADALTWAVEKDAARRQKLASAWALDRGLPLRAFALAPVEMKPLYVDFESVLLTSVLARQIRRTAERGGGRVRFTEMLPGPDECWLRDAAGNRYTSELRLTAVDLTRRPG
jgi:hypothetical protein